MVVANKTGFINRTFELALIIRMANGFNLSEYRFICLSADVYDNGVTDAVFSPIYIRFPFGDYHLFCSFSAFSVSFELVPLCHCSRDVDEVTYEITET